MRPQTNYFLIGLFVVAGFVILTGAIMALGGRAVFVVRVPMETYIAESVQGLEVGAPLRYRGVPAGQVDEITLVSAVYDTEHTYVLVRVSVRPEIFGAHDEAGLRNELERRVANGLRVRLAAQGLTGILYLEAQEFEDARRFEELPIDWTPRHAYVPSVPSTTAQLTASLLETFVKLERSDIPGLVEAAKQALLGLRQALEDARIGELSRGAQRIMSETETLLRATREDAHAILTEGERAVHGVRESVERFRDAADPESAQRLVRGLADAAEEGRRSLAELRGVLARGQRTLRRLDGMVAGQSTELAGMLANLRRLTEHLARLAATLERYPSLMFFGERPAPMRKR